jgi:hypothetical protein
VELETRDFIKAYLKGYSKKEQVDRLVDLAAELEEMAEEARADLRDANALAAGFDLRDEDEAR